MLHPATSSAPHPTPQGLCAEYDAARASLDALQAAAASALEGVREGLRGRGHAPAALRKVKLVEWKGEALVEVRGRCSWGMILCGALGSFLLGNGGRWFFAACRLKMV